MEFTAAALPSSAKQQPGYPAHDPSLEHYSSHINRNLPEAVIDIAEDHPDPDIPTPTIHEFVATVTENLPDEEQIPEILSAEALALDSGILPDHTNIDMDIEVVDPARIEEVRTSNSPPVRSHNHTNPKSIAYLLGVYPAFCGVIKLLKREDHTHFTTISIVTFAIAFLNLCILALMYELFGSSNSSHQNVNLCWYRILQVVYYILCFLPIILLLPLFF